MFFIDHGVLFGSFTNLFILGWLALVVGVFLSEASAARRVLLLIGGRLIPGVLFLLFLAGWLVTRGLPGDITSLDGVLVSYSVPEKVLNAWFELLGLVLLVARWMIDDTGARSGSKALLLVSLVATFVAAAIGVIVYVTLNWAHGWVLRRTGQQSS